MKTKILVCLVFATAIILAISCKKEEDQKAGGNTWNISAKTFKGADIATAKGTFTFTSDSFTVHIRTSRVGNDNVVMEFDMAGQISGDSILVHDNVLLLGNPVEIVTVNGGAILKNDKMSGSGNYSIVQPSDTVPVTGVFLVTGDKE